MTFPGFCPSGTRFGWTSFECIPTAFSLPSLLEDKSNPMAEPPAPTTHAAAPSSGGTALAVGGFVLAMAAAAAVGIAAANASAEKKAST